MKIGFYTHPRKNIIERIEWIGKNKFDFVDFFIEEDKSNPNKIDAEAVKKVLKKYKLGIVGHTAWYLPIGSPVKRFREAAIAEAENCFKILQKMGVKYVTIHANWPHSLFKTEEGIKFQVDSLKKLIAKAKKYNLSVMYEPVDGPEDNIENISRILKMTPGLFLHIDIGHSNLHGRKPEEIIKRFHKMMKHVHLHDNNGAEDQHLPMGTGNIDWEEVIKTLKKYYDGTITLEIFSRDMDYVLLTKKKVEKMWYKK